MPEEKDLKKYQDNNEKLPKQEIEVTENNTAFKNDIESGGVQESDKDEDRFDTEMTEQAEPEVSEENKQSADSNKNDVSVQNEVDKNKTLAEVIDEADNSSEKVTDNDIDKAVDDIVRTESDEAIAEADAKLADLEVKKSKKSIKEKVSAVFSAWWLNKPARYGTFVALFILFVSIILLPTTRYTVLNAFGVRVTSSMSVIDSQTRLPLKNISVSLQDKSTTTNADGYVEFTDLKLGASELVISKRGYADSEKTIVLGWGSNPIGEQEIVATGEQFTFVLSDWQSGEPITKAEATAGENSAVADDTGKIILTVGEDNIADITVTVDAENYRQEVLDSQQLNDEEIKLKLVPARKHVFVSNRSGEYDVYKIDLDKKNEEILLGSTGNEREVPVVLQHPTRNLVALVSSRDGEENRDGFILDGLFIIDVNSGETKRIARSEQLQLLGWSGDNLIFWQVVEGTSKANPERSKIISYNERTAERTDLAAANYFNDIEIFGSELLYAVSSFAVPQSQAKLYSINLDSTESESKILQDQQVWSMYRTGFTTVLFNAENQKWYEYSDGLVTEAELQPSPQQIEYVNSPKNEKTAWVEVRDGKGVLLQSQTEDFTEEVILTLPGLSEVLYWVNDTSLVFRVITGTETADYIIDSTNKEPLKITDISATLNSYF